MESDDNFSWAQLNDFMPKGHRVIDAWIAYKDQSTEQSFDRYMHANYPEAMMTYRTARRILNGK